MNLTVFKAWAYFSNIVFCGNYSESHNYDDEVVVR